MTLTCYDIGDQLRLSTVFYDPSDVATDPTAVTLTIRLPDGTSVTPTATNDASAVGAFYADYAPTMAGTYRYKWAGTGTVVTLEEGEFYVRQQQA